MPENRITLTLDAKNLASKEVKNLQRSLESATQSIVIAGKSATVLSRNTEILLPNLKLVLSRTLTLTLNPALSPPNPNLK